MVSIEGERENGEPTLFKSADGIGKNTAHKSHESIHYVYLALDASGVPKAAPLTEGLCIKAHAAGFVGKLVDKPNVWSIREHILTQPFLE